MLPEGVTLEGRCLITQRNVESTIHIQCPVIGIAQDDLILINHVTGYCMVSQLPSSTLIPFHHNTNEMKLVCVFFVRFTTLGTACKVWHGMVKFATTPNPPSEEVQAKACLLIILHITIGPLSIER